VVKSRSAEHERHWKDNVRSQLIGERVRILKKVVPNLDKLAMVLNGNNANSAAQFELLRTKPGAWLSKSVAGHSQA
jgi:hypothetical protein